MPFKYFKHRYSSCYCSCFPNTFEKQTKFLVSPLSQQEILLSLGSNMTQFSDYRSAKTAGGGAYWKCKINKNKRGKKVRDEKIICVWKFLNSMKDANAHSKVTGLTFSFQTLYLLNHTAQRGVIPLSTWVLYLVRVPEALQLNTLCYYLYFCSSGVLVVHLQGGIMGSHWHSHLLVFVVPNLRK